MAAAALVAVVLVQVLPQAMDRLAARQASGVTPDPFPLYSHVATSVERAPVAPALMTFTHGLGVDVGSHFRCRHPM